MKIGQSTAKAATLLLFAAFSVAAQTATSVKVKSITMPANSTTGSIKGDLKDGQKIDLDWAAKSNVACFPGTRFEMFNGNHIFYRITLPKASEITVTVTPTDGKAINLYALRQGAAETAAPPNITSAISCEASYPIYANTGGGRRVRNADDGTRKIEFMSVSKPYSILIGVAGAEGLTDGSFTLNVEITGR